MKNILKLSILLLIFSLFNSLNIYASDFVDIECPQKVKLGDYTFQINYGEENYVLKIKKPKGTQIIKDVSFSALSDGKKLYYAKSNSGTTDIYERDLNTDKDIKLINLKTDIDFVRIQKITNKYLYFDTALLKEAERKYMLHRFDLKSTASSSLGEGGNEYIFTKKTLYALRHKNGLVSSLYSMNLDGKNKKKISDFVLFVDFINNKMYYIIEQKSNDNIESDFKCNLYTSDADGKNMKKISKDFYTTGIFGREGMNLIFMTENSQKTLFYSMDLKTGKFEKVKNPAEYEKRLQVLYQD